jgi:hypothetical protein
MSAVLRPLLEQREKERILSYSVISYSVKGYSVKG